MAHITFPKPRRGDYKIERRQKRLELEAAEQAIMQAALRRDHGKCRFPRCEFAKFNLKIDPAHFLRHRGMGGNPEGDRTESTGQIVALCRRHHDMLDRYLEIEIEPMSVTLGADGPLCFYQRGESGRMEHVHTEPVRHFSETRGA